MKFKPLINTIYKVFSNGRKYFVPVILNSKKISDSEKRLEMFKPTPTNKIPENILLSDVVGHTVFIGHKKKLIESYKLILIESIKNKIPFTFINNEVSLDKDFLSYLRDLSNKYNYPYKLVIDEEDFIINNSKFFMSSNSYIFNLSNVVNSDLFNLINDQSYTNCEDLFFDKLALDNKQNSYSNNMNSIVENRTVIISSINDRYNDDKNLEHSIYSMFREARKNGNKVYYYLDEKYLSINDNDSYIFNTYNMKIKRILELTPNFAFLADKNLNKSYNEFIKKIVKNEKVTWKIIENQNYVVSLFKSSISSFHLVGDLYD